MIEKQDYSPYHIANLLFKLTDDSLEHYLTEEDYKRYYNSNFNSLDQLNYWLEKLVKRIDSNENGYELFKRSLRKIILSKSTIPIDIHLPTIDDTQNLYEWEKQYQTFLLRLWNYLFQSSFKYENPDNYQERIDEEFVKFPQNPELWNAPIYN